jgi:hypothetical protein
VLLHGLMPETLGTARQLLRQEVALSEGCDGWVKLSDRSGLAAGISSQDLAWFGPPPESEFGAPSLQPGVAAFPVARPHRAAGATVRVEAEGMRVSAPMVERESLPDGACLALYTNGELATDITVPATGLYEIGIRARGTPAQGAYPRVVTTLDDSPVGSVSVFQDWRTLSAVANLPAGRHVLKVAFVNDLQIGTEDRNLWVDWISWTPASLTPTALIFHTEPGLLTSLPEGKGLWVVDQVRWDVPGSNDDKAAHYLGALLTGLGCEFEPEAGEVIPAAQMAVTAELQQETGEGVTLATNGVLETEVEFASEGRYVFAILASGTPLGGIYPRVELRVDGAAVATADLRTGGWRTYRASAQVKAGVHRIALAYVNDEYRPPEDRNLSVGRLTIAKADR